MAAECEAALRVLLDCDCLAWLCDCCRLMPGSNCAALHVKQCKEQRGGLPSPGCH